MTKHAFWTCDDCGRRLDAATDDMYVVTLQRYGRETMLRSDLCSACMGTVPGFGPDPKGRLS